MFAAPWRLADGTIGPSACRRSIPTPLGWLLPGQRNWPAVFSRGRAPFFCRLQTWTPPAARRYPTRCGRAIKRRPFMLRRPRRRRLRGGWPNGGRPLFRTSGFFHVRRRSRSLHPRGTAGGMEKSFTMGRGSASRHLKGRERGERPLMPLARGRFFGRQFGDVYLKHFKPAQIRPLVRWEIHGLAFAAWKTVRARSAPRGWRGSSAGTAAVNHRASMTTKTWAPGPWAVGGAPRPVFFFFFFRALACAALRFRGLSRAPTFRFHDPSGMPEGGLALSGRGRGGCRCG